MPSVYRRTILKHPGLSESKSTQLAERLTAAIERQQNLSAKSAHILQLTGELQENEVAFFVGHEPAEPFPVEGLFDPSVAPSTEKELLDLTAALFDALRVAHGGAQQRPGVHGGLCPGVLLQSPDGITKISDFGVAPAICSVLGIEKYLNLAIGPETGEPADACGTGVWSVLDPGDFEHDNRICGFVDPEQYGTGQLDSFEPGSDIIAAAFIVHLMAEHRHPYLFSDPDAHRLAEMSEFMAMGRYNGARRKELRESSDAGVRQWCELMDKLLARVPENRPTAREALAVLEPYVKPLDAGEIQRRRLENAEKLVGQKDWAGVRAAVKGIVGNEEASADVVDRAGTLLREADANLLLIQATELLKGEYWLTARQPLDTLLALPALPPAVAENARKASGLLNHNLDVWQALEKVEVSLGKPLPEGPAQRRKRIAEIMAPLEGLPSESSLLPLVRDRRQTIRQDVSSRLEQVEAELQAVIDAEHAQAHEWFTPLQAAFDDRQWETVEGLLGERPTLQHWPAELRKQANQIERSLLEHQEQKRRQAAIDADHRKAAEWIASLREAAEADQWDRVGKLLEKKPKLTYWPDGVIEEADEFAARLGEHRAREADFKQAGQWCDKLRKAAEAQKWSKAADILARRPELKHWPEEVLDDEALYKGEVEQRLEAIELERRRAEEEKRRVQEWFTRARQAAWDKQWKEALDILESPPAVEQLPSDIGDDAEKLKKQCLDELTEETLRQLDTRTQKVHALAEKFVRNLATQQLSRFVEPGALAISVEEEQFASDQQSADGCAQLVVAFRESAGVPQGEPIAVTFDFQLRTDPPRVCDDDGKVAQALMSGLTAVLHGLQKLRSKELFTPLREGLFPQSKVKVRLEALADQATAVIDLPGSGSADGTVETGIAWDPVKLHWTYAEPGVFAGDAAKVAAAIIRKTLGPRLLEGSETLRDYQPVLGLEVNPPPSPALEALTAGLQFEARLTIRTGGKGERGALVTFPVAYPLAKEAFFEAEVQTAETELVKVVVATQTTAREELTADLRKQLAPAATKVKLAAFPKRISNPTDQVTFELRAKRRDPQTLTAVWDRKDFTYQRSNGWEESLADLLAPPETVKAGAGGLAKFAIIGMFVVAALGSAGYFVVYKNNASDTPPTLPQPTPVKPAQNDNQAPQPQPEPEPQQKPEPQLEPEPEPQREPEPQLEPKPQPEPVVEPAYNRALARIRAILLDTGHFGKDRLDTLVKADSSQTPAVIRYRIPGLAQAAGIVQLDLSADGKSYDLPAAAEQQLDKALAELEKLWQQEPVKVAEELAAGAYKLLGGFIDPSKAQVSLEEPPQWDLSGKGDAWEAGNVIAKVTLTPKSRQKETITAEFTLALQLTGGKATAVHSAEVFAEKVKELSDSLLGKLAEHQVRSLERQEQVLWDYLQEQGVETGTARIRQSAGAEGLNETAGLIVESEGLVPREFGLHWVRGELEFGFDAVEEGATWQDRVRGTVVAYRALAELGKPSSPQSAWLRNGSPNQVKEVGEPAAGTWVVAVAAPWSSDKPEAAERHLLRIAIPWPEQLDKVEDATDTVGDILKGAEPPYWPLVVWYNRQQVDGEPLFLGHTASDDRPTQLSVGGELGDYLNSGPHFVVPELTFKSSPAPKLIQAPETGPPTLEVPAVGRWSLAPDADAMLAGIDAQALRKALATGAIPTADDLTFTVSPPQSEGAAPIVNGVGGDMGKLASSLGKVRALDDKLNQWEQRGVLEERLGNLLGENDAIDAGDRAMEILRQIWRIKGAEVPGEGESLADFSQRRRRKGAGIRFPKLDDTRRGDAWIFPTVFVEYFSGPEFSYAVVWSISRTGAVTRVHEGPKIRKLTATADLMAARGGGFGFLKLGDHLFKRIFAEDVRQAIKGRDFDQLGLVLALDDVMWWLNGPQTSRGGGDNLARVSANKSTSYLKKLGAARVRPKPRNWNALRDLRVDNLRDFSCDYVFVQALSNRDAATDRPTADQYWAIEKLYSAGEGGR